MILFSTDWQRYPNAIVHTKTRNRSFLRMSLVLRDAGIKNHAFILALHNPALENVNPFDYKNLTQEQQAMIAVECAENPWYFFRECARAPAIGAGEPQLIRLNRGNIALWWCFFNHILIFLIQPRQTGKSFSTDLLMILLMNILCQNTKINLITKDDSLRRANIQRIKDMSEEIPIYLQFKNKEDANNTEAITIRARNNYYNAHVPSSSEKRAYNMGRGLTSAIMQFDEAPFQTWIERSLPAALAATGAAVDEAKKNGTPYGTIITTTAGKKDDRDGKFVYGMLSESAVWDEKFLDCENHEELVRMILLNSPPRKDGTKTAEPMINATFNHQQLGYSDEWLEEKLSKSFSRGDDANRDYFNMWTSGSQSSPLPTDILDRITASKRNHDFTDISQQGYITRWYIPENEINPRLMSGKFVLGMDTSNAVGGDNTSFYLMDIETLETIATGTFNETNLIRFSAWLADVLVGYSNITIIPENRSSGQGIIDFLILELTRHGIDPFRRIFNMVVQNSDTDPTRWKEIQVPMSRRDSNIYDKYKGLFGFATSGTGVTSRTGLYSDILQNAARRSCDKIRDGRTIMEITGLITKNGRIDHPDGEHDDMVIAWLLSHWLITNGKNLYYYGIDQKRIGCQADINKVELTEEEYWKREEQLMVREKIENLLNRMRSEVDDFVSDRIEREIMVLNSKIVVEQGTIYSIDQLIASVKEDKKNRRKAVKNNSYSRESANQGTYRDNYGNALSSLHGTLSDHALV